MFIVERLTSRSSVALAVSIGYVQAGCGRGTATRSRGPDGDACSGIASPRRFFLTAFPQKFTVAFCGILDFLMLPRREVRVEENFVHVF